jgi:hypothetical protein
VNQWQATVKASLRVIRVGYRANRKGMKTTKYMLNAITVDRPEPTPTYLRHICLDKGFDDQDV